MLFRADSEQYTFSNLCFSVSSFPPVVETTAQYLLHCSVSLPYRCFSYFEGGLPGVPSPPPPTEKSAAITSSSSTPSLSQSGSQVADAVAVGPTGRSSNSKTNGGQRGLSGFRMAHLEAARGMPQEEQKDQHNWPKFVGERWVTG